jgi:transcription elongation GreA/GreB family factor
MSRAFVKEDDGSSNRDDQPDRPLSRYPNYVTPRGHEQLVSRLAELRRQRDQISDETLSDQVALSHLAREIRYLEARVETAIVVDPATQPPDEVAFGASVDVEADDGSVRTVVIVGEDEADPAAGLISYVSPLACALMGSRVGDLVTWARPAGDEELEIKAIRYS